jgi:LPXTG-motif cell wall-anchored protein
MEQLTNVTSNIEFFPVTEQEDYCESCTEFRNNATIQTDKSSTYEASTGSQGNWLRTLGIYLMIGGAFSLVKKIFG